MFNERMGNETGGGFENQDKGDGKKSLKKFDRDCEAKQEILLPLLNYPDGLSFNDLYRLSGYQGKKSTFKSNLSKYSTGAVTENGKRIIRPDLQYVNRIGKRGEYVYSLNDNGVQKAINDPLFYRRKQWEEHKEWKKQFVEHHFVNTEGGRSGGTHIQYVDKPVNRDFGDEFDKHSDAKKESYEDLMAMDSISPEQYQLMKAIWFRKEQKYLKQIENLENNASNNTPAGINPKEHERQMKTEQRIVNRKELVERYKSQWLDGYFFGQWGMYPVWVKGKNPFKKGNIEIMSKNNPELAREGHTKGILPPNAVIDGYFHITKMTKAGIYVIGEGMKEEKLMTW
ncbi:hypothetical protein [Methanococcoides sp. FTZ1]|uniref:hypothetical protein n=1 Tax=Methanococcoides sp. FTZ1 TaxID=3439061 RepID=UPI003F87FEDB